MEHWLNDQKFIERQSSSIMKDHNGLLKPVANVVSDSLILAEHKIPEEIVHIIFDHNTTINRIKQYCSLKINCYTLFSLLLSFCVIIISTVAELDLRCSR